MKNELVEKLIINFQKRWASKENLELQDKKATVIREGKKVTIIPKVNEEYTPNLVIKDVDVFEQVLRRYLEVIKNSNLKSTRMDQRHTERYFLFNIWKNATVNDYLNPEKFINRYTNFILDDTFKKYDNLTDLGAFEGNILLAKREEDDYGFETPYIMHLSFTDGKNIYNLPWIRYGISLNRSGEKIAYIYALQKMEACSNEEYNEKMKKILNRANKGVKKYRNVTPSAISALTVFMGMLEKEGITAIKVPDFLVGRYGNFAHTETQEENDRIQSNLTNKFLRNFIRLSEQFENIKIETGIGNGIDSFLCISLEKMKESNNEFLNKLYYLGMEKKPEKEISENYLEH